MSKVPLIVILGPTAAGKTTLSIRLAADIDGEVISADSRLFYRGMDIGTAKPAIHERQGIPHHLIDVAAPDDVWSLAKFQRHTLRLIQEIFSRGKIPLMVGGTGQYIRSITEGWEIPKQNRQPGLRCALEKWAGEIDPTGLYQKLLLIDPQAAARIDPKNLRRTIRALEVILSTGRKFSTQRKRSDTPYKVFMLGLTCNRSILYQRIDQRIETMIRSGLIDEVRSLVAHGYDPDLPALSAIGYSEIRQFLSGIMSLDDAIKQMKRRSRQFVRRQANWFKPDDPNIHWVDVEQVQYKDILERIQNWLRHSLPN